MLNWKSPVPVYVLAGASSVALSAFLALAVTRTVHADAPLFGAGPAAAASVMQSGAGAMAGTPAAQNAPVMKGLEKRHRLHGLASWYGGIFNGRTTASGEPYDMYAMTACHPTLPFGSLVRVINRRNHRSVVVRITDRGDLVDEGRIIDLSYGAAEKLAMVESGIAPVDLQVLSLGKGGR
ncbi:MAG TPA: septal ring lytic transglycosylase RlpA family protein [Terracidiphilus sp.]|jgi:rare lipoprotein A (peptidoglycan hydrolase)|nr:septal ring lytic transglycosylase RlpA family protein [Terracidiphilus sp.]